MTRITIIKPCGLVENKRWNHTKYEIDFKRTRINELKFLIDSILVRQHNQLMPELIGVYKFRSSHRPNRIKLSMQLVHKYHLLSSCNPKKCFRYKLLVNLMSQTPQKSENEPSNMSEEPIFLVSTIAHGVNEVAIRVEV